MQCSVPVPAPCLLPTCPQPVRLAALQADLRRAMASQAAQRAKQEGGHLMTGAVSAWLCVEGTAGGQGRGALRVCCVA